MSYSLKSPQLIYILSEKSYLGAKNLPVIKINYYDRDIDLSKFDALIFTSKNGVEAIDRVGDEWKEKEIYSIGSGTSKTITKKGVTPFYTAKSSYGDDFAKEIKDKIKDKKVLFLRAKVVTSKLNEILRSNGIELSEEIVYETICNSDELSAPEDGSVIIFSSPSTIECFFKRFNWLKSYKAVVIGSKTAGFMPKNIKYILSKKQTIPACIELAKNLTLSQNGVK